MLHSKPPPFTEIDCLLSTCITEFKRFRSRLDIVGNVKFDEGAVIPIPYFGDVEQYLESRLKVVTVGLNPSDVEFCDSKRPFEKRVNGKWQSRFNINSEDFSAKDLRSVLSEYFNKNPYADWFSNFEQVLQGIGSSYYPSCKNRAVHIDLCSPFATFPTWSKLRTKSQRKERAELLSHGSHIFQNLIALLKPNIVLFGVGKSHLGNAYNFITNGELIFRAECVSKHGRTTHKTVLAEHSKIGNQVALFANGSAFNKPFGNFTNEEKRTAGQLILCKYNRSSG